MLRWSKVLGLVREAGFGFWYGGGARYKEHLIKRHGQNDVDVVWIKESELKNMGFDPTIINPRVD